MLIIVAVLMGLTALAATVSPPPPRPPAGTTASPTPGGAPAVEPAAQAPGDDVVQRRLDASEGARPARVRARIGDTVVLDVTGDVVDTVVIGELPAVEPIEPASPAHIELHADTPGRFPIKLLEADRRIGVLEVALPR